MVDVAKNRVLIVGVSGLVGYAAARHFAKLADWDVIGVSRRLPEGLAGVTLVPLDLTDRAKCATALGQMVGVTHVVYAALYEKPGLVEGWVERDQMKTNLAMFQNVLDPLTAAGQQLQHVSLLQGTKAYGIHIEPFPVPARERWPRHPHENFYFLQEDYMREKQLGTRWSWTILRPQLIFGDAVRGNMNVIPAIGTYAAILRGSGEPLHFPGGGPRIRAAVDADLLARALEWSATSENSRNEIFNIANGDVFVWHNVWPVIADALGMEVGENRPMSLANEMPKHEDQWAKIVVEYNLRSPSSLQDFVGSSSYIYADFSMEFGSDVAPPSNLVSTIKAREAGFTDCIDTEDMFRKWFSRLQDERLLPPRDG